MLWLRVFRQTITMLWVRLVSRGVVLRHVTALNRTPSFNPDNSWAELTRHITMTNKNFHWASEVTGERATLPYRNATHVAVTWHVPAGSNAGGGGCFGKMKEIPFPPRREWKLTRQCCGQGLAPTHGDRKLGRPNFSLWCVTASRRAGRWPRYQWPRSWTHRHHGGRAWENRDADSKICLIILI